MNEELISRLKEARDLARRFSGGWSERFDGAEELAEALDRAVDEVEAGNLGVLEEVWLWFLPTSDWDDLIGEAGRELGEELSRLLAPHRPRPGRET